MKKIVSFLLIIFSFLSLSSCNKSNEKIVLKVDYSVNEAIDLYATKKDKPNLRKLKDDKENFLLYVYVPGCINCSLFNKIYDEYAKENHALIYKCDTATINSLEEKTPQTTPYMLLYKEGKINETYEYSKYEEIFNNKERFGEFMDKNFILDNMPILDKNTLDEWITNNKEFVVYFGWNECSDCTFMNENYLYDFLNNSGKSLYYFETAPYRADEDDDLKTQEAWLEFKKHYGFGSYNNGRVPSICYYKDGKCIDFAVYLNDILEFDEENNSIKIVDSYYKENPHIGEIFKGDSLMNAYVKYKEASKEFFNKEFDKFFARYLK